MTAHDWEDAHARTFLVLAMHQAYLTACDSQIKNLVRLLGMQGNEGGEQEEVESRSYEVRTCGICSSSQEGPHHLLGFALHPQQ